MGSYFHVIERKVGGNLDAFRRELGRLRESGHFHRDRHERIMRIAQTVGFGHIVRQCLVDTGHRAGCEVWVADGERWRWSAIGAYPTLDMAVAVGEGFLSVKPYRVRRVTDVGDGFHDFLAEEVFANALTGRMRLLREKFGHKGRG